MDNTVGSLTQLQRSVIVGSILGDGYLRIIPGRNDAFMEFNHALSQKEYVDWKYDILYNIVHNPPKRRKGNGKRKAYRFFTKQLPELTKLMHTFYVERRKIALQLKLDPVILAVWYMDDGSMCRSADVYLNSQQFDMESQMNLIKSLSLTGLEARLNKDKQYYRIRFLKRSISRFFSMINPYIVPSMMYKMSYDPVETTRRSPNLNMVGMKI